MSALPAFSFVGFGVKCRLQIQSLNSSFLCRGLNFLGPFRTRLLPAAVTLEITRLWSQVKARHQLWHEDSCVSLLLKGEKGAGDGFPSYCVSTQHRALWQSPLTMKSGTLLGPHGKEEAISPMKLMVVETCQHSLLFSFDKPKVSYISWSEESGISFTHNAIQSFLSPGVMC